MEKTVIEQETNTATETQERTFTQAELNSIIEGRLKKESAKYSDYEALKEKASKFDEMEEAKKSELQKANEKADALQKQIDEMVKSNNIRTMREKVAKETGIPVELLNAENEEACIAQAKSILAFKNDVAYPTVKDGGEATAPTPKQSTEQQFADWFNASLNN